MPFSGERLAPRGNPKSWSVTQVKRVDNFNMRIRCFVNGTTERCDIEVEDGANKRRIHAYEGPHSEVHGDGFVAGYAAGVASINLKPLTPPPKRTSRKRKLVKKAE
jgi:hypothetical protein